MLPGPSIIRKCEYCSGAIEEFTLTSGNTGGATFWSDGYCDAPMLPDRPWLVKCPHCNALLWLDELEIIEELEPGTLSIKYPDVDWYSRPKNDDFYLALNTIEINPDKEQYLRFRIMWNYNDKRRWSTERISPSDAEKQNMERLLVIMNNGPDAQIMRVEILRELSRFEDAEAILNEPFDEEHQDIIDFLRRLINDKKSSVVELK